MNRNNYKNKRKTRKFEILVDIELADIGLVDIL